MNVYVDTGIFIDYLSKHALGGAALRSQPRRGRGVEQLNLDATDVLKKISDVHTGATSCLTFYEVEEALLKVWSSHLKGVDNASILRVLGARSIMPQVALAMQFYNLRALDLTAAIVTQQLNHPILHVQGVRAADALHVCTAINFDAELIVSADDDILQLDGKINNSKGIAIRCVDTNTALQLL